MKLKNILEGLNVSYVSGNGDIEINKIAYDSRNVQKGDAFVCITGFKTDGHKYAESAVQKGAVAIICERDIKVSNCAVVKTDDTRKALAVMASNYFDHPERKLKIIGITGTNGKTTSTYMMKHILETAGFKVGLIGTIANYICNKKIVTHRTTPESFEIFSLFNDMVNAGVNYCVMEVSSHSLVLKRVYGITFDEGIFTNLTRDHLDFHKTFENYFNAKMILFKNSKNSIINIDDKYGKKIPEHVKSNFVTYAINNDADVMAKNINMTSRGAEFRLCYKGNEEDVKINIPGMYNVYNALSSASACLNEGIEFERVKEGLETMDYVPGRCEVVSRKYNLDFDIIIDYAHTPDGLSNILKTAREFTKGRLISVFGCGGDRDKTKRPIMGDIGTKLSDIAIVTSDNPRSEEPESIIKDIVSGIKKDNYIVECDRKKAIKKSIEMAKKGDVIVIAGKGHEDYQILKDKTIHFDEREIVADIIKELF